MIGDGQPQSRPRKGQAGGTLQARVAQLEIGNDGKPDFRALRSRGRDAMLVAFDLLEHSGADLRDLPLLERKRQLARLIGNAKIWRAIQYCDHLTGDGATVFAHVCRMGLEGIVSKRVDAPYRSGPSKTWLKSKNQLSAGNAKRNGARCARFRAPP